MCFWPAGRPTGGAARTGTHRVPYDAGPAGCTGRTSGGRAQALHQESSAVRPDAAISVWAVRNGGLYRTPAVYLHRGPDGTGHIPLRAATEAALDHRTTRPWNSVTFTTYGPLNGRLLFSYLAGIVRLGTVVGVIPLGSVACRVELWKESRYG